MDAQIKTEAIEDSIDAIDTSMQYLIDEADSYLRAIHSRRQSLNSNITSFDRASTSWDSTGNNSSTLADSTGSHSMGISGSAFADSTGRDSTSSYSSALTDSIDSDGTGITGSAYAGSTASEETNESIPPADNITAASSVPSVDNNNSNSSSTESAGSDSTVLYSLDETMPRAPRTISPSPSGTIPSRGTSLRWRMMSLQPKEYRAGDAELSSWPSPILDRTFPSSICRMYPSEHRPQHDSHYRLADRHRWLSYRHRTRKTKASNRHHHVGASM